MLTVMKILRLLLMASAYSGIVQLVQELKRDPKQVSEERHKAASVMQTALQHIIPATEQKLKHTATQLAKQHREKVGGGSRGGSREEHMFCSIRFVHTTSSALCLDSTQPLSCLGCLVVEHLPSKQYVQYVVGSSPT